jgi:hypothetical protein
MNEGYWRYNRPKSSSGGVKQYDRALHCSQDCTSQPPPLYPLDTVAPSPSLRINVQGFERRVLIEDTHVKRGQLIAR